MCIRDMYVKIIRSQFVLSTNFNVPMSTNFHVSMSTNIFFLLIKGRFVKKMHRSHQKVCQMWKVYLGVKERQKVSFDVINSK